MSEPGTLCDMCGHPFAVHDVSEEPMGPCALPGATEDEWGCVCEAFRDPYAEPSDAGMPAWARPDTAGPTETTRAAWRQHEETHR